MFFLMDFAPSWPTHPLNGLIHYFFLFEPFPYFSILKLKGKNRYGSDNVSCEFAVKYFLTKIIAQLVKIESLSGLMGVLSIILLLQHVFVCHLCYRKRKMALFRDFGIILTQVFNCIAIPSMPNGAYQIEIMDRNKWL